MQRRSLRELKVEGQLDLFGLGSIACLKQRLEALLERSVDLVLTENSSSMLSARICNGVMRVRLHSMFLHADDGVIGEIAAFLATRRKSMPLFRGFVRDNRAQFPVKPPKKISARTRGKVHDLGELFGEVNRRYFGGSITAAITWGAKSPRWAVRKRTLGSYSERTNMIRINPALDRKSVPPYYVAFVVYHEMLHASLGTPRKGARRSIHSKEFRSRERLFDDFDRAMAWERGEKSHER